MSINADAFPNNILRLPTQINPREKLIGERNKNLAEQNKRPDEIMAENLKILRDHREIALVKTKKLQESTISELQLIEEHAGIINNISQLSEKMNQAIKKRKEKLNETSCTVWKLIVGIIIVALLITGMAYGIFNVPKP